MTTELKLAETTKASIDMREHPLFKNRRRVLAVPAHTKSPAVKQLNLLLINLGVAVIIIGIFIAGIGSKSPEAVSTLTAPIGRWWDGALQIGFGSNLGTGLAEKSPWIMARATGIVAYLMLFVSVAMGLTLSMRPAKKLVHPAVVAYLHKLISLSVLVFTALHVLGLMLDSYLKISLLESLLPFSTSYRPEWTGLGTIALYLLLAVIISASLAGRLGYKVWRGIHFLTFGIFFATLLHGLMAGTDSTSLWMQLVYMATGFVVVFLTTTRFVNRDKLLKR